jgi:hypothetical protein
VIGFEFALRRHLVEDLPDPGPWVCHQCHFWGPIESFTPSCARQWVSGSGLMLKSTG